jgi:hypothetical protein
MKIKHIKKTTMTTTMAAILTLALASVAGLTTGIGSAQAQCTPDGVFCVGRQQLIPWLEGSLRLDRYTGKVAYLSGPRTIDTPTQQADRFNVDGFNPAANLHWIPIEKKAPTAPDQDIQSPGTVNYGLSTQSDGGQLLLINLNTGLTWILAQDRRTQGRQWTFFPVE